MSRHETTIQNHEPSLPGVSAATEWSGVAMLALRISALYIFIQAIPLDWKFYRDLLSINWTQLAFNDIFNIAHYAPAFSHQTQTYTDWLIIFIVSIVGGLLWQAVSKDRPKTGDVLYYWIRTIARYRLAIAVIGYGFIKFFPIQAPYPSLSNLNTHYGDFTRWKLFSLSLGIVPGYQSFLGSVEILAGLLLIYRRTASMGAFIVILFTGNVFMSNLAYEGGEQVYSLYLIVLAVFVLSYDLPRLTNLLIFQRVAAPNRFTPVFTYRAGYYAKTTIKIFTVFFFVLLYGFKTADSYYAETFRFPKEKGLANVAGLYNVSAFQINDSTLGYSDTTKGRWRDVVFEKWNTLSIRSNHPVIVNANNRENFLAGSAAKAYELEGCGERQYYAYTRDSLHQQLVLQNKNGRYADERLVLSYKQAGDSIQLWGVTANKDALHIVLNRIHKKYLLQEVAQRGRQKAIRL